VGSALPSEERDLQVLVANDEVEAELFRGRS
jgi:hypothetical protein